MQKNAAKTKSFSSRKLTLTINKYNKLYAKKHTDSGVLFVLFTYRIEFAAEAICQKHIYGYPSMSQLKSKLANIKPNHQKLFYRNPEKSVRLSTNSLYYNNSFFGLFHHSKE